MKFQTSIMTIQDEVDIVRGKKWDELLTSYSFVDIVYLILLGKEPTKEVGRMFEAMLSVVMDHGPGVASALSARISASAKNPLHTSLAAGLLSLGERHGLAINGAMEFFYKHVGTEELETLLAEKKKQKIRIPGFGHRVYTTEDVRVKTLFKIAKENGFYGKHSEFAWQVREILSGMSSRELPINVDGAIAAILCDMGWDARFGNVIFLIGRVPGILAHIIEEIDQDQGIRRLKEEDIEFIN